MDSRRIMQIFDPRKCHRTTIKQQKTMQIIMSARAYFDCCCADPPIYITENCHFASPRALRITIIIISVGRFHFSTYDQGWRCENCKNTSVRDCDCGENN